MSLILLGVFLRVLRELDLDGVSSDSPTSPFVSFDIESDEVMAGVGGFCKTVTTSKYSALGPEDIKNITHCVSLPREMSFVFS
jgi:hypothetical protein